MLKMFSMLVVAGGLTVAGVNTASAAQSGCVPAAPTTAQAPAARAPVATARPGTQTIRRYSASPGYYRAPMSYRSSRSSSGPSYSATRKILGY